MKKLVASVGLMALGISSMQAVPPAPDPSKPWSVGVTLRGFYDDNVLAEGSNEQDSIGFEISPFAGYVFNLAQGTISLGYTYSLKWYDDPPDFTPNDPDDDPKDTVQTHSFDFAMEYAFGSRYDLSVRNSFVIGQEPDLLRSGNTFDTFQPVFGDNIRNYGSINLNARLTPVFGLGLGYNNAYFNYDEDTTSSTLDRIEHMPYIDGRWQLQPNTVGILGYQFREIDYTADEELDLFGNKSDIRNSSAHYVYVGAEHSFTPAMFGAFRAGASFIDYYNDPNDQSDVAPYFKANLRYTYLPESYLEVGASYDRSATELFNDTDPNDPDNEDQFVQDAQTAALWASLTHRITPKIFGSLMGQIQNSLYEGSGNFDGDSDWFFTFGANLEYRFNAYFSSHIGYNYDNLNGDTGRDFTRNRVYIGFTAVY
jgi:hypothetical protein